MKASMWKEAIGTSFPRVCLFLCLCLATVVASHAQTAGELESARDRGDLAAIDRLIAQASSTARSPEGQYKLALANSYGAEVAMEQRDKKKSEAYAEKGLDPAQKAVAAKGNDAEFHRLQGALCGQVIPANPL